ncbi:hypothetical protein BDQ17DRAFT_1371070 [Cyathus striatus]|nr:hypothetical protein BDQ17DRAFT_1371070 [Cyathus striatus]
MLNAAKNFVIQNGVFIDVGGNAKLFSKKLFSTPSRGLRYADKSKSNTRNLRLQQKMSQLISDYQQFRRGDIKIIECIDEPVQAKSVCNDFVIQVLGENTKRAARIYRGKTGYNQLKMELELLSKMWPHPNIPQVFGIYKSNDTTGLIFYGDGIRLRCKEYMFSLQPLQRAAFFIKYVLDYINTFEYLGRHINSITSHYENKLYLGGVMNHLSSRSENNPGVVDFYVDSSGRLNAVLSISIHSSQEDNYDYNQDIGHAWNIRRPLRDISQSDLELVCTILSNGSIISGSRASMTQKISACHRTFLWLMKTSVVNGLSRHTCHNIIGGGLFYISVLLSIEPMSVFVFYSVRT